MKYLNIKSSIALGLLLLFTIVNAEVINKDIPKVEKITISNSETYQNKDNVLNTAKNYAAFWNTGDAKYLNLALSDNFMDLNLPEGRSQGKEGPKSASETFRKAVPNLSVEIKEIIVSDNKAVVQYQFKGNFTGIFNDKKGNGDSIDFKAVDIYTIKAGKIMTNWHLEDNLTLLLKMKVVDFTK